MQSVTLTSDVEMSPGYQLRPFILVHIRILYYRAEWFRENIDMIYSLIIPKFLDDVTKGINFHVVLRDY